MSWLLEYCETAERSDQIVDKPDHLTLLLTGLVGEAGGVLVEFKKRAREGRAYPCDEEKLSEELGDVLWYLIRTVQTQIPSLINALDQRQRSSAQIGQSEMQSAISLSTAASNLLQNERKATDAHLLIMAVWEALIGTATKAGFKMRDIAKSNTRKRESRWPADRQYIPLFDEAFPKEEQLPRQMEVEFLELASTDKPTVILRCNGLNIGDRLTDNIQSADDYRFHDVFHFAHAAYLGWSPVLRKVLKCKRKSDSKVDENEDGARAGIIEEAVSAMVFNRAKDVGFFHGIDHVDYDLLKAIKGLVRGYEVERVPLWQWDEAIRGGFDVFRQMKEHGGGRLSLDMRSHRLSYA